MEVSFEMDLSPTYHYCRYKYVPFGDGKALQSRLPESERSNRCGTLDEHYIDTNLEYGADRPGGGCSQVLISASIDFHADNSSNS